MSSSRLVAKTINAAGRTYSRLYRVLCLLRAHRLSSDPMAFQDFQSRLFETLLALQELYDRVSSTRSRHISRKAFVTEGWFLQRMRATDSHLRALREAMRVGKALGDAFAWPFYLNDAQLLDEHATAVRQDHVPSGVGGRSLLQVMRGLRTWRGYFLLYHDITTTLRRGDFSLVAFERMRIAGLGEQKAGKPQDGMSVLRT